MDPNHYNRRASIDIFRGLNMFLMLFVIDAMTLSAIPQWIGHTKAEVDGMGLADVVFPAFLFLVGLSIPSAISNRKSRNESSGKLLIHVLFRTFSLVLIGLFIVNLDHLQNDVGLISKNVWQLLLVISFFLIWNHYRVEQVLGVVPTWVLRSIGVALLVFLAIIYQARDPQNDSSWMQIHWWGILGLIGWSYGFCALLYLWLQDRVVGLFAMVVIFFVLNIQEFMPQIAGSFRLIISASNYAMVMSGVLVAVIVQKVELEGKILTWLISLVLLLLVFGFGTRHLWGISKIMATPSWAAICTAISIAVFLLLYMVADKWKYVSWAKPLSPAGRNTLTCYVLPYAIWSLMWMMQFQYPHILSSGYSGLLRSFFFAGFVVFLTHVLDKQLHIKLKL
ncbi:MAG: DUF5009 domain-containing protein [Bacteroidota bacterium]